MKPIFTKVSDSPKFNLMVLLEDEVQNIASSNVNNHLWNVFDSAYIRLHSSYFK